jgi:hypothetical protein
MVFMIAGEGIFSRMSYGSVVGQVAAGDQECEVTVAHALLSLIDLNGVFVTGDTPHCQGETTRLIKDFGVDEWRRVRNPLLRL